MCAECANSFGSEMTAHENAVQRNYKDTVFRLLFKDKEALLSLYNAVNGTNFSNVEDVEIATLENAIYMSISLL